MNAAHALVLSIWVYRYAYMCVYVYVSVCIYTHRVIIQTFFFKETGKEAHGKGKEARTRTSEQQIH